MGIDKAGSPFGFWPGSWVSDRQFAVVESVERGMREGRKEQAQQQQYRESSLQQQQRALLLTRDASNVLFFSLAISLARSRLGHQDQTRYDHNRNCPLDIYPGNLLRNNVGGRGGRREMPPSQWRQREEEGEPREGGVLASNKVSVCLGWR